MAVWRREREARETETGGLLLRVCFVAELMYSEGVGYLQKLMVSESIVEFIMLHP